MLPSLPPPPSAGCRFGLLLPGSAPSEGSAAAASLRSPSQRRAAPWPGHVPIGPLLHWHDVHSAGCRSAGPSSAPPNPWLATLPAWPTSPLPSAGSWPRLSSVGLDASLLGRNVPSSRHRSAAAPPPRTCSPSLGPFDANGRDDRGKQSTRLEQCALPTEADCVHSGASSSAGAASAAPHVGTVVGRWRQSAPSLHRLGS
mmetsp:Transcript_40773/g.64170  ORF Transcript_40773/g.64170 Transcript_40773/m.64170 type:complete len:200 (+) Transcript_40773:779-1378(+)